MNYQRYIRFTITPFTVVRWFKSKEVFCVMATSWPLSEGHWEKIATFDTYEEAKNELDRRLTMGKIYYAKH